ncbi:hypothetical protein RJT34_30771 [Clitoria ternatea]|uniref:F-box/LRR-repeat protein 15-like leucin rich repeat domain-containing protein n=1 Tax=Clitoria ternatea TaxID=43366 RepID=A0AAN9I4D1_CLITE
MGQSPSTLVSSPDQSCREISYTDQFGYSDADSSNDSITGGRDYTAEIPNECLAKIFQFLTFGDRKNCFAVYQRWLGIDGKNHHQLSLNTNLMRLKLRRCREVTKIGMENVARNCNALKKLSCVLCVFGAMGVYAFVNNCTVLKELFVKRLRGFDDSTKELVPQMVSSSLKLICLKELVMGQSFTLLIIGSKKLQTLRLFQCLGNWDLTLKTLGKLNSGLVEIHLEKVQVGDVGLLGISKCSRLETLHLVKTLDCSDVGHCDVAEGCKMLKKLYIDGWRTNRIDDCGLISVAKHFLGLQELMLIGMCPSSLSLTIIASSCQGLERFALCGIGIVGDVEIECIAAKCMTLKKMCIKGCPVSNAGISTFSSGYPNLVKLKVRKCKKVTSDIVEWMREMRGSLAFSFDHGKVEVLDGSDLGVQESSILFHSTQVTMVDDAPSSSNNNNNRLSMFRTKFGFLGGRNFVPGAFRRWANVDEISDTNF